MPKKEKIEDGKKYNYLTIIKEVNPYVSKGIKYRRFLCECDCGNKIEVNLTNLRSGNTLACGCKKGLIKHLMSRTRFYHIWQGIKNRCLNKKYSHYKYYGGKGIKLCKRWLDFDCFMLDMLDSYNKHIKDFGKVNTSIDRINNQKGYSKENCRWATKKEQVNNRNLKKQA